MFRAIIIDRLTEREYKTKKCISEEAARTESTEAIKRLCKKNKISEETGRFYFACIEIEKE